MGFIAPEQYRGKATFASDLYSLAATIVYLITGMNPSDIPHKNMLIDWRRVANVEISSKFGEWLDTMLDPIPERRSESSAIALAILKGKKPGNFLLKSSPPKWEGATICIDKTRHGLSIEVKINLKRYSFLPPLGYRKWASIFMIIIFFCLFGISDRFCPVHLFDYFWDNGLFYFYSHIKYSFLWVRVV